MKLLLPICGFLFLFLFFGCETSTEKAQRRLTEGKRLIDNGQTAEALQAFEAAIQADSTLSVAYFYRGTCRFNLDPAKSHEALADLDRAIRLNPDYADAWAARGEIKFFLGDSSGACEDWRRAGELGRPGMRDKTKFCP